MAVDTGTIAVALGVDAPEDGSVKAQQWEMWISDAEMLIEARREALEADPVPEPKLDYVIREAVVAHVRRPDDATQVTVDGISKTYRTGRGKITILDEWWSLLGLTAPTGGAFAVDTVSLGTQSHADICALNFGGEYCSCGAVLTNLFPLYGI